MHLTHYQLPVFLHLNNLYNGLSHTFWIPNRSCIRYTAPVAYLAFFAPRADHFHPLFYMTKLCRTWLSWASFQFRGAYTQESMCGKECFQDKSASVFSTCVISWGRGSMNPPNWIHSAKLPVLCEIETSLPREALCLCKQAPTEVYQWEQPFFLAHVPSWTLPFKKSAHCN